MASYITYNGKYVTYNGKMVTYQSWTPSLNVTPDELYWSGAGFPCSDEYFSIDVANPAQTWTASKQDTGYGTSWFSISAGSGSGDTDITVTVNAQSIGGSGRSAQVYVSSPGCTSFYVDIIQSAYGEGCT
jgi:hypothetical protein